MKTAIGNAVNISPMYPPVVPSDKTLSLSIYMYVHLYFAHTSDNVDEWGLVR